MRSSSRKPGSRSDAARASPCGTAPVVTGRQHGSGWTSMEPRDTPTPAWATEAVHVVEPDPEWATQAEDYAAEIQGLLDDWLSGPVTHVGSTAVPGLAAKPISDRRPPPADPAAAMVARQNAL